MNKINSTIVGRQSSMDDIRGYFNRVYNQMKEDPEGRYPANFGKPPYERNPDFTGSSANMIF